MITPITYKSARFNNQEFIFDRINIILGANGSGKSSFLSEIRDSIPKTNPNSRVIYIEGGRTIKIADVIKFDARNFNQFDKLETAIIQYEGKRTKSLADRLFDAIVVLEQKELQLKSKHSDEVVKWASSGKNGDCPTRPSAPLDKLFNMFSEIFPQITLSYDYQARRLSAQKNEITYGPSKLSDGEKQVFSILADLIDLDDSYNIIIADEPELNLHPELAERLWSLVEDEFPEKIFIYATHSINFTLREKVNQIYVLSTDHSNIAKFSGLETLPRADCSAFLGGLPGILSANKVIVTEGHEKSFDSIFYRWLLGDSKIEIFPAGGCTDVIGVVTKSGLWEKISSNITLTGVIDSDYKEHSYSDTLSSEHVLILPFHEAESYLCLPEILSAIAVRIGSQEKPLTPEDVLTLLKDSLCAQRLAIAARRVFAKSKIDLAVSLEKKVLAEPTDKESLVTQLKTAAEKEIQKAVEAIGPSNLEYYLDIELSNIDDACSNKDPLEMLKYLPGKQMLNILAPKAGCRNGTDLMRALKSNFPPEFFNETKKLKNTLLEQHK
jgi:ABC-type lipoprotein export system ATPase subunit